MKRPENRLKVSRLLVLGAGASYAATVHNVKTRSHQIAPLDKEFCEKLVALSSTKRRWVKDAVKRLVDNWKDHRAIESFGLEQAIIYQLGYLEFIDQIHRRRSTDYDEQTFLRDITHLVAFLLDRSQENRQKVYDSLARYMIPLGWKDDVDTRIVTFNYDTLLDRHLLTSIPPKRLYFDRIAESANKSKRKKVDRFRHPFLIKLHGSINWRCNQSDFERILERGRGPSEGHELEVIWQDDNGVPTPEDNVAPCLMPPLPSKPLTKIKIFRYLWTKAAEYLAETEELIVCGYSLPQTDSLAGSLFGGAYNERLKRIVVIDPDPLIWRKWKDLLGRPSLGSRPTWQYFSSIEEFLAAQTQAAPVTLAATTNSSAGTATAAIAPAQT